MTPDSAAAIRKRLSGDFHRPTYHFLPPSNWMNDPNGAIHWKGQYHIFYQHNPFGPLWGNMHWAHATSPDLIHWQDQPIAIAPTPGSYDESGIFSGCMVNDNGKPVAFYTATKGEHCEIQTQAVAFGSDDLLQWQKHPGNPVVAQVPAESHQNRDFRDPFVWKEADAWYMVIGSRIQDVGGAIFLYRSQDLLNWEYLNPLLVGDINRNGVIWECPNFFKLGDKWVLIISAHLGKTTGSVLYFVGKYENYRFTPEHEGVLDYDVLYAPLSFVDGQNRRVMYGWLRESRNDAEMKRAGWSGVQAIPRILSLDSAGRLVMQPVPELNTLRGQRTRLAAQPLNGNVSLNLHSLALDISAEFAVAAGGNCGLALACSPDGKERFEVVYDASRNVLISRRVMADLNHSVLVQSRELPHALDAGETLQLRVLLDGSVVEIIANGRTSITNRIYPNSAEHNGVQVLGAQAELKSLEVYEMSSIWQ